MCSICRISTQPNIEIMCMLQMDQTSLINLFSKYKYICTIFA